MIPEFLKEKLINQYGLELTNQIIEGYKRERNTSIRINNLKTTKEDVLIILKENILITDKRKADFLDYYFVKQ